MNYKQAILNLIKDIRFWIFFFFIIHLSTITLPPLEPGSTWRQTDGLMVARNFYERDSNILYPTVDVAGEKSGIIGCEFPILNYLIYLISLVFGYASWYGRLINLIVSSIGVFFFYKLIKDFVGKGAAFNSVIIVLVSIWFTYNRTNIPDTFAASLCFISLYFGVNYLKNGKPLEVLIFFILGLTACLSKISSASLLTVLAVPFFFGVSTMKRKIILCFLSCVILISVIGWYFVWVPYLNSTYGFTGHFFMGMSFNQGIHELLENWQITLGRFYDTAFKYTGFILFIVCLFIVIKKKQWTQFAVFILPFSVFLFIMIKSGYNFPLNAYYMIMFIPPMAFIMGYGLSLINNKTVMLIALLIVGVEGIANQIHVFEIREPGKSLVKLEAIMDSVSNRHDLIAITGSAGGDPTQMYLAHRRGWAVMIKDLSNPDFVKQINSNGCKYIVIIKKQFGVIDLSLPQVYDSEDFRIYKIQ